MERILAPDGNTHQSRSVFLKEFLFLLKRNYSFTNFLDINDVLKYSINILLMVVTLFSVTDAFQKIKKIVLFKSLCPSANFIESIMK
jgi:hypothetical protein